MNQRKPKTLKFPTEIIDHNKHRLRVKLRRYYRLFTKHQITRAECRFLGEQTIRNNYKKLTKKLRDYVTKRGLDFKETEDIEEELTESLEWWGSIVQDM